MLAFHLLKDTYANKVECKQYQCWSKSMVDKWECWRREGKANGIVVVFLYSGKIKVLVCYEGKEQSYYLQDSYKVSKIVIELY